MKSISVVYKGKLCVYMDVYRAGSKRSALNAL